MEQELEMAQAYMEAKNYESAFNILHPMGTSIIQQPPPVIQLFSRHFFLIFK